MTGTIDPTSTGAVNSCQRCGDPPTVFLHETSYEVDDVRSNRSVSHSLCQRCARDTGVYPHLATRVRGWFFFLLIRLAKPYLRRK